jgi:hypothetical protein
MNKEKDFQHEFKKHLDDAVDTFKEMKDPGKFNFGNEIKNAIEIIKLNTKAIHSVATRKTTATAAVLFIVLATVAMNVGLYLQFMRFDFIRPSILSLVINGLIYIAFTFVVIFIYDIVASQFFKGKGKFGELFRVLGYGNFIMILGVVPMLGGLAGIWYLVITYKALTEVKKLNPTNSVLTILIAIVIAGILSALLSSLIGYGPLGLLGYDFSF